MSGGEIFAQTPAQEAEQLELLAAFKAEFLQLEVRFRDRQRKLDNDREAELCRLEARQELALVKLWQRQGKKLGAYARAVLEGKEVRGGKAR